MPNFLQLRIALLAHWALARNLFNVNSPEDAGNYPVFVNWVKVFEADLTKNQK